MSKTPPISSIYSTNDLLCVFIKPNGERCGSYRLKGSDFCFHHDPHKSEERLNARKRGGKKSQADGISSWADRGLETVQDVENLIQDLINVTVRGEVHPRVINATVGLLNLLLKVKDLGSIEERIAKLEETMTKESKCQR